MDTSEFIAYAKGEREAELLIRNARLVNVLAGCIEDQAIAIAEGMIVGLGELPAKEVIDLAGRFLAPGLIDAHCHIESSMVGVRGYAMACLPHGITSIVSDLHEIANVMGLEGIRLMRAEARSLPLDLFVMLPSCVPATDLETSGAKIRAHDLKDLIKEDWVIGLGEVMNFPGVIAGDLDLLAKIALARSHGKRIDGHAPALSGKGLSAYIAAGITSDHECTTRKEAAEKLGRGMHIMIREGSTAKNLKELLSVVTPLNARRCMFVTDDRHPADLISEGGVDHCIREAIRQGLDPICAIQMATINPASYFPLPNIGVIAPGYQADLVVLEDLVSFQVHQVFKKGRLVAQQGRILPGVIPEGAVRGGGTFHIANLTPVSFRIKAAGKLAKVIELVPKQIFTKKGLYEVKVRDGQAVADPERDILKIAVVERHRGTGNVGLGFVKGFGFQEGAIASSVAHDSHNIVVVGADDEDMALAVKEVARMQGGLIAVKGGKILASLPLPIGGLMSDQPLARVKDDLGKLHQATKGMGCPLADPFMPLSFLALPVIPELKITDKGVVDVKRFQIVPLFGED